MAPLIGPMPEVCSRSRPPGISRVAKLCDAACFPCRLDFRGDSPFESTEMKPERIAEKRT